jgi:hypothetical protein
MIDIRPGVKFKLWFFGCDESPGRYFDVMGVVQQVDDQPWEMVYRTRSSDDDNPWNNDDQKDWYRLKLRTGVSADSAVENMTRTMSAELPFPVQVQRFDDADHEEVLAWLEKQPWAHMKLVGGNAPGGDA